MTDEWRLEPLVARVVAWHNRHPLARRITPQQVQSLGFVALPFAATTAAFSADFIAPVSPARVARWAARHAREAAAAPAGGPLKQVAVDGARVPDGAGVVMRYVMTAAMQADGGRSRLLIGPDARSPVLGRRLWSRPRAAAAGSGALAALALVVAMALGPLGPTAPLAAAPATTAAAPVVAALAPLIPPPPPLQAVAHSRPAPADPALDEAPPGRDAPPDAEPRLGRIELPPLQPRLVPPIDSAVLASARQTRDDLMPPPAMAGPDPAPPVDSGAPAAALPDTPRPPPPIAAAVPQDAFWALTTRLLRTRAESMQLMQAVDELLREHGSQDLKVEMLPSGDDWRVVGWPFRRRADAERAQAMLLARGLKVEVVDF
jgi:hypothetical protein